MYWGAKNEWKREKTAVFSKSDYLKPHGCLSWHLINSIPYSLPDYSIEDSLIITPGLNKYREGYSVPFDIHRARANEEIDKRSGILLLDMDLVMII